MNRYRAIRTFLIRCSVLFSTLLLSTEVMAQAIPSSKVADGTEPAWSPDGEWILMSVLTGNQRDLYVVRPDGSERRQITDTPESELLGTWSRDGRIAFVKPTDNGLQLFVMETPLADARRSHEVQFREHSPAFTSAPWTPDGLGLTVVVGERNELDIYRVPLDGALPTPLVSSAGYDSSPAWSVDGRLAFVSERSGNRDIWVQGRDGGPHPVTMASASDDSPAWSPDGRWIAFVSDRSGAREIHVVPAEGGAAMQLTNDAAWAAYPAWSPDGSTLAYVLVTRGRGNDHLKVVTIPDDLRGQ